MNDELQLKMKNGTKWLCLPEECTPGKGFHERLKDGSFAQPNLTPERQSSESQPTTGGGGDNVKSPVSFARDTLVLIFAFLVSQILR